MDDHTFDAFISYSHRDLSHGIWLQKKLETFHIPNDMRGDRHKGQRLRIFRDQTDLAGTELQDSLRRNLEDSRFLIVICSPSSAASPWVDQIVARIYVDAVDPAHTVNGAVPDADIS